jgi:hypothetical protein
LATLPAEARAALDHDESLVDAALQSGLSHSRRTSASTYWRIWSNFCLQHQLEPYMPQGPNAVYWLEIFAVRVRTGQLSASNLPVRADTVADALAHVGTAHTMANFRDPRHNSGTNTLHPRLIRILNGFRKQDSPATRVLPIPVQVLQRAFAIAVLQNTLLSLGAADLIWLAFFFLLRPGEYTVTGTEPHPFTLADVRLWHNSTPLDPITAPADQLLHATFVVLIFTDQKNAVRGETVGHGRSGDPHACPVLSTVRRILHLRTFNASPSTPLCALNARGGSVSAAAITSLLRLGGAAYAATNNNIALPVLHQKALRATGASALLSQGASVVTIKLLGHWKSDAALRYLHLQSKMSALAPSMLSALQ